MHSSYYHSNNSPPETEFASNSGHHYHPYNRGYRGRRPYRARGGYQHGYRGASWKTHTHVSVKEEPTGDSQSLLARLEPTPDSLAAPDDRELASGSIRRFQAQLNSTAKRSVSRDSRTAHSDGEGTEINGRVLAAVAFVQRC